MSESKPETRKVSGFLFLSGRFCTFGIGLICKPNQNTSMEYLFPNMELPFAEYVYFDHMFQGAEIEHLLKQWSKQEAIDAEMSSGSSEPEGQFRKSEVQFLDNSEANRWIYDKLTMVVQQGNMQNYGFDLQGFREKLQLTQYSVGDHFEWHMDFGPREISHRKLSITVQLSHSDDYEGGDLLFRSNNKEVPAPRTQGTVVVFPSFVQHRVTPITKGVRRSIVGWASGHPYR